MREKVVFKIRTEAEREDKAKKNRCPPAENKLPAIKQPIKCMTEEPSKVMKQQTTPMVLENKGKQQKTLANNNGKTGALCPGMKAQTM